MSEAKLFQALSDGTRLEILSVLAAGTVNVSTIVAHLGCSQPAVSRHLRVLREASLIRGARKGKQVEYSINPGALRTAVGRLEHLMMRSSGGKAAAAGGGTPAGPAAREVAPAKAKPGQAPSRTTGPAESRFKVERKPSGMDDFLL